MNSPYLANYGNPPLPQYGYPGTYNQFNTYNSFGPSYYNQGQPSSFPPNMNPSYGSQPVYQPQPNYSAPTPPPNPPPSNPTPSYNPYGNLPSGQVSLGTVTYSGENSSKPEPKKQNSSGVNMNVL